MEMDAAAIERFLWLVMAIVLICAVGSLVIAAAQYRRRWRLDDKDRDDDD